MEWSPSSSPSSLMTGLREVCVDSALVPSLNNGDVFSINTGGSLSTLHDLKSVSSSVSGVLFVTPNSRFLVFRVSNDIVELSEYNLDCSLSGRQRAVFNFNPSMILADGVSLHLINSGNVVVMLVATVTSLHRFNFVLKESKKRHLQKTVLSEAAAAAANVYSHFVNATNTMIPTISSSTLSSKDEALFALANAEGDVHITKLGYPRGMVASMQLKCGSYLTRLWDTFASNSWIYNKSGNKNTLGYRGTNTNSGSEAVLSLCFGKVANDDYAFAVCRDHRLRVWSLETLDCVQVENLADDDFRSLAASNPSSGVAGGAQRHVIKKVRLENKNDGTGEGLNSTLLIVFVCLRNQSRFALLRPHNTNGKLVLKRVANIVAPDLDLVDFDASSTELCSLWTNSDNEPVLRFVSFSNHIASSADNSSSFNISSSSSSSLSWINAVLQPPLDSSSAVIDSAATKNPRQEFLNDLLTPGRFSSATLIKALKIYRRGQSSDTRVILSDPVDRTLLREEICVAVEAEICSSITNSEISDDHYREVAFKAWSKFHSCAVQYEQAANRALGLSCHPSGLILAIKQDGLSFLRPMERLENMFYTTKLSTMEPSEPLEELFHLMNLVDSLTSPNMEQSFSDSIRRGMSAEQASQAIINEFINQAASHQEEEHRTLHKRLNMKLDYLVEALESLLSYLELDNGVVSHEASLNISFVSYRNSNNSNEADALFSSQLGLAVVSATLSQLVETRFDMCRSALVLQQLLLSHQSSASSTLLSHIHSTFLPRFVVMTHCFNLLVFLANSEAQKPSASMLESNGRQMSILGILPRSFREVDRTRTLSLSELFLATEGGKISRDLLTTDLDYSQTWRSVLLPFTNILAQLLWPRCAVPHFQKFLLSSCQHSQIQEYVRLQSGWCDWHCHSRQFLLALALLNTGEAEKACDLIVEASIGVHKNDDFIHNLVFDDKTTKDNQDNRMVVYFLKCIELFQFFGYYDCVVDLAEEGIRICDAKDPNKTTLCHILFLHHLRLQHHDSAYRALILNPDKERRKDSLRQFTITLLERKKFNQLSSYLFVDMLDDFEALIVSRARTVDVVKEANYYHFLYAFHCRQDNFRKAAFAMYELGLRLSREAHNTLVGLKNQAQAYLAAINCLCLVSKKGAWIMNPELSLYTENSEPPQGTSPKRPHDDIQPLSKVNQSQSIRPSSRKEVIEIEDIQNELDVVNARLALVKNNTTATPVATSPGRLEPNELLLLLVAANLFEEAVKLGFVFNLDFSPLLEALSSRCVQLSRSPGTDRKNSLKWLSENTGTDGINTDQGVSVDGAFAYLQSVMLRCELSSHATKLHRVVANQFLAHDIELPAQLVLSYKKRDANELMRVYFSNNRIEKATELAIEYVGALLGQGKEYFGLDEALNANSKRQAWLPYHLFDVILKELEMRATASPLFDNLRKKLLTRLDTYFATAERVASDRLLLMQQQGDVGSIHPSVSLQPANQSLLVLH